MFFHLDILPIGVALGCIHKQKIVEGLYKSSVSENDGNNWFVSGLKINIFSVLLNDDKAPQNNTSVSDYIGS